MNILLTNDDGYFSSGIQALANRLKDEHNVVIVAPDSERSGYAHMVNFFSGIRYKKIENGVTETYAISGSPADCVIFAVKNLFVGRKFDVVISGINSVLNIGTDLIYSGTFGAAQEGTFHRIPSIAVSLRAKKSENYAETADFIAKNLSELIKFAEENITINVNVPCPEFKNIKGIAVVPFAYRPYIEEYTLKVDEDGVETFFSNGHADKTHVFDENTDVKKLYDGYVTVTPVQMIANDFPALNAMKTAEFKL